MVSRTSGRPLLLHNVRDRLTSLHSHPRSRSIFCRAGIAVAGAYPRKEHEELTFHELTVPLKSQPFKYAYLSVAPLEDVDAVDVFSDSTSAICNGILLRYSDGTERSLGQCRFGLDDVEHVEKPVSLCYSPMTYKSPPYGEPIEGHGVHFFNQSTRVRALGEEDGEATRYEMRGTVEFWSAIGKMDLKIVV